MPPSLHGAGCTERRLAVLPPPPLPPVPAVAVAEPREGVSRLLGWGVGRISRVWLVRLSEISIGKTAVFPSVASAPESLIYLLLFKNS